MRAKTKLLINPISTRVKLKKVKVPSGVDVDKIDIQQQKKKILTY
jgi:hypothetical protein